MKKNNESETNEKNKVSMNWLTRGSSRYGMVSMGMTAIVIVIIILLNLIVGKLPTNFTKYDISDNGLYDISDTTKDFVDNLQYDIKLIVVCPDDDLDVRIEKFVDEYADLSNRITVDYVDPITNPTILDKYDCENGNIVISCEETGKTKIIPLNDYSDGAMIVYTLDSSTYSYKESYFDGDSVLTNGINYVISGDPSIAYFMTGHGESSFGDNALSAITNNNIEVSNDSLDLLVDGSIPDDCDLLVSYAPTTDLADNELTMIQEYLQSGGNLLLLINESDLTNFNSLLSDYGLEMQNGAVGDTQNFFQQLYNSYGYFCIYPELSSDSEITSSITGYSLLIQSRGLLSGTAARDTITTTPFMTTSDGGLLFVDEDNYTQGQYILGAMSTESISSDIDTDKTSNFTVITAASLIDSSITDSFPSFVNLDIFANAVSKTVGGGDTYTIYAKSLTNSESIQVNGAAFFIILFVLLIPLAVFIGGMVYWNKRRKR